MVIQKRQFPVQEAFVGNEFVIILFLLGLAVLGAIVLTRTLHLGSLASIAVIQGSALVLPSLHGSGDKTFMSNWPNKRAGGKGGFASLFHVACSLPALPQHERSAFRP